MSRDKNDTESLRSRIKLMRRQTCDNHHVTLCTHVSLFPRRTSPDGEQPRLGDGFIVSPRSRSFLLSVCDSVAPVVYLFMCLSAGKFIQIQDGVSVA